jgi:hypothetical protein
VATQRAPGFNADGTVAKGPSTDDVLFTKQTPNFSTVDKAGISIEDLRIDDQAQKGAITLDNTLTVQSIFYATANKPNFANPFGITGPKNLVITTGQSVWAGFTSMTGTGQTIVGKDATLTIAASADVTLGGRTLVNNGTVSMDVSSTLNLTNGASITNAGTMLMDNATLSLGSKTSVVNAVTQGNQTVFGLFDMEGTSIISSPQGASAASFTNNGDFRLIEQGSSTVAVTFNNYGRVWVGTEGNEASLTFKGGGTSAAAAKLLDGVTSRGRFASDGGEFRTSAGSTIIFTGIGGQTPVYVWRNVTFTDSGEIDLDNAKAEIPTGNKATFGANRFVLLGANAQLGGAGDFVVQAGREFDWQAGSMFGSGKTVIQTGRRISNAVMIIGNSAGNATVSMDKRTIQNFGEIIINAGSTINLTGAAIFNMTPVAGNGGVRGVITFDGDSNITGDGKSSVVNQPNGLVEKTEGNGTTQITAPFSNGGVLVIFAGTLKIPNLTQNEQKALKAATSETGGRLDTDGLFQLQGGVLENTTPTQVDEVVGDVLNTGGEVEPGGLGQTGILTIDGTNGTYTQTGQGALDIDLQNPTPGTGSDQLVVTGQITLGGYLNINVLPGFTGDRFVIINNESGLPVNGIFNGLPEGTHLVLGGRSFHITYVADGKDDVVLEADPSGTVTLNQLNNNVIGTVSFNDGMGNSGTETAYFSQFNMTYVDSTGSQVTFNPFCIDLAHKVSVGQTYAVYLRDDLDTFFANGGRMAYIDDNFGQGPLSDDQAAAVQIALWDLSLNNHNPTSFSLDADGTYSSGDESVFSINFNGNPLASQIASLVNYYLGLNGSAPGSWLDASAAGLNSDRGQSVLVPDAALGSQPVITGATVSLTAGQQATVPVAFINEPDPTVQASSFQVSINWGDGSAIDNSATVVANGSGAFEVLGTHTFTAAGNYSLNISLTLNGTLTMATGTAIVQDAPLSVQVNLPTFTAAQGSTLSTGSTPDSVAAGDLLGNGITDLVVANFNSNTLSVYIGDGKSGFTHLGDYTTGRGPNGIVIAPDGSYVAVGNYYDGTVSVFATQPDGSLVLTQTLQADAGTANRMALADLTGSGVLDLVTANENGNDVTVFMGSGDGTFGPGVNYAAGNGPVAVVAGDFTGSGKVDLAVADYNDSTIQILPGNGDGTFGAPVQIGTAPGNPFDLVSADFNGDGSPDLAVASVFGQVTVLLNNGNGTFRPGVSYNTGSNPTQLTVGDFNGDGIPDIAVSNFGSNTIGILTGNGDGTFQPLVSIPASGDLNGIISGDFNGNGQADLAVVGQDNNTLQVFLNTTALQATEYQPFSGLLASFSDANPSASTADFTATIDWGDGTQSQVDSSAFSTNNRGGFDLSAGHTYTEGGTYDVGITIDSAGGSTLFVNNTITVADLSITASGTTIQGTEGQDVSGVIATLMDTGPNATAAEYSAFVDWGDGTFSDLDSSAFSANSSGGFNLTADHTYAEAGSYTVNVIVTDQGGSEATASTTANIADALLTASGTTFQATEGQDFNGVIASFTDAKSSSLISVAARPRRPRRPLSPTRR